MYSLCPIVSRRNQFFLSSGLTELSNIHHIVLILQDSGLIVVYVEVVGGAENSHHARESSRPCLSVHSITGILSFMCADNGEQVVLFKKRTCRGVGEEIRAAPNVVMDEEFRCLLLAKFLKWICPENVTHKPVSGWLAEAIDLSAFSACIHKG